MQYPYNAPLVLTDTVFTQFGGQTGSSTVVQRQAAYLLAEEKMTEHLRSFLVPTVITGTVFWRGGTLFETEFGNIQRVILVRATTVTQIEPLTTQIYTGSVLVRNAEKGFLDITFPMYYRAVNGYGNLYDNQAIYESGFSTGTVTQPDMLAALSMAAQIYLNMWVQDLANESTADIGVQSFSNQGYSESRVKLGRTAFGNSAMAQQIASLVRKYKTKTATSIRI